MKKCTKCLQEKSDEDFYIRGKGKSLMAACKKCVLKQNKNWSESNKNRHKELVRRWDLSNKKRRSEIYKSYRSRWPEKVKEFTRSWRSRNKGVIAAHAANRRASILAATPFWADLDEIKNVYKNCPSGKEVDHIIPLNGKAVCGLHVTYNLQYLSRSENMAKFNRIDEDIVKILNRE